MKRITLVLCALAALSGGVVAYAQGAQQTPRASAAGVVGTAQTVDETALAIEDRAVAPAAGFKPAGQNTLSSFIRMVVVLAFVVAMIYLFFRLMKRLSRPRLEDDSAIKVLASAGLGAGKALHVVSLGTKAFLIGASESSVSLITEIEDKDYVDALALKAASAPRGRGTGFAELLASMLGGRGRKAAGRKAGGSDFLAAQRERLRKF